MKTLGTLTGFPTKAQVKLLNQYAEDSHVPATFDLIELGGRMKIGMSITIPNKSILVDETALFIFPSFTFARQGLTLFVNGLRIYTVKQFSEDN